MSTCMYSDFVMYRSFFAKSEIDEFQMPILIDKEIPYRASDSPSLRLL